MTTQDTVQYEGCAGAPYGHVPGFSYHDVKVTITRSRAGGWRAKALETWGSAQGYDEEHGRSEVSAYGDTPIEACHGLEGKACWEDPARQYLATAIARALDAFEEDS